MLLALGPKTVYLKGGHLRGSDSPDILMTTDHVETLEGIRVDTKTLMEQDAAFLRLWLRAGDVILK